LNWNKLHLFEIDLIFTDLKNYQNLIEGFLSDKKVELEQSYDESELEKEAEKAGAEKDNYLHHLIDSFAERHQEISRQFPHNFRASFLVQIISCIESELKKICNHYGNHHEQKFTVDDLKGSDDLEKCKTYLKLFSDIDFNDFNKEWQFIKQCKFLRNKIVHNDSKIKRDNKNLINFAKKSESIELINFHEPFFKNIEFVIIDNNLIDELLTVAKEFFNKFVTDGIKYSR